LGQQTAAFAVKSQWWHFRRSSAAWRVRAMSQFGQVKVTAVRTEEEGVESPAIKKEKGLLSPFQGFTDRVDQGA
jgi:hypothetical protein